MPKVTPAVKREATASYGAEVVLIDDAGDRAPTVERLRAESGAVFIPPYDHPAIIAGQGTVGLEIVEDAPDVVDDLCAGQRRWARQRHRGRGQGSAARRPHRRGRA